MVGMHRGKTNNNNGDEPANDGHSKVDSCAFLSGRATLGNLKTISSNNGGLTS